ncbi:hypothetical protein M1N55_02795 [Dehalococcoidia bacterium]|nr:hypothetical protein [Dehalococcoidia bacterium]
MDESRTEELLEELILHQKELILHQRELVRHVSQLRRLLKESFVHPSDLTRLDSKRNNTHSDKKTSDGDYSWEVQANKMPYLSLNTIDREMNRDGKQIKSSKGNTTVNENAKVKRNASPLGKNIDRQPLTDAESLRRFIVEKILEHQGPMKVTDIFKLAKTENQKIPGKGNEENIIINLIKDPKNRFCRPQKGVYGLWEFMPSARRVGIDFPNNTKKATNLR